MVLSEDRPPRLVVDSSISGVTCHTFLPNKAPNPILTDVRRCLPLDFAQERMCALVPVLDVSKAHRRVHIRPSDQGLLCFQYRDRLYQSITLRLLRLLYSAQSVVIFVDYLLAFLERSSAPVWACLLTVAILVLNIPMGWHKASGSSHSCQVFCHCLGTGHWETALAVLPFPSIPSFTSSFV